MANLRERIFTLSGEDDFEDLALEVYQYQFSANPIYRRFCQGLGRCPGKVNALNEIPFLPIEFFRDHEILCEGTTAEITFFSSGTTGSRKSKHLVADTALYRESFLKGFGYFYGELTDYTVLALLPSYQAQKDSSLLYMAEHLIHRSGHPDSGFFREDLQALAKIIRSSLAQGRKTFLLGVSYALLDMAEKHPLDEPGLIVVETGGMKGRREEMTREELHYHLSRGFGVQQIHSEYGMTELLSQAWSQGNGIFHTPPWMKVLVRDPEDPLSWQNQGQSGGISIIDLANVYSCPFIATQDLGKVSPDGGFEVLGRFDASDIRGCNLLIAD